jgi:acetylcholinesterase
MVERMTRMWEQFAYRGNPNNATDEYLRTMVWPKHDSINEYYLEIGTHMVEKHGLYLPRFVAWDQLSSAALKRHNLILIAIISLLLKLFM